jgi:cathepsin B
MTIGIDSAEQCCERCGETANCAVGVYQPPGLCHLKSKADMAGGAVHAPGYVSGAIVPPGPHPKAVCPSKCKDGSTIVTAKASSAYAVGAPGDVEAMQRELMTHGPFEVGFEVFSDFGSYKNGTYARTQSATGPGGGHAVKLIGWGFDVQGVAYWTIANSWTSNWGEQGFFKMKRGVNECGIEETSAAGLPVV